MSAVLKWLQNMANEEWEYEDGDYALEAIKFFNSLRAENKKLREALRPFVELGLTEAKKEGLWGPKAVVTMYVRYESISNARAALESMTETPNVP